MMEKPKSLASRLRPKIEPKKGWDTARLLAICVFLVIALGGIFYLQYLEKAALPQQPVNSRQIAIEKIKEDNERFDLGMHAKFKNDESKTDKSSQEFIYFYKQISQTYSARQITKLVEDDRKSLLERVEKVNPDIRKQIDQEKILSTLAFTSAPACQGKFYRFQGQLLYIYTEKMDVTMPTGQDVIYWGVLQDRFTRNPVWFYLIDKPKQDFETIQAGDTKSIKNFWAQVEGIYLRLHTFETQMTKSGRTTKNNAAVIFAKNFSEIPPPAVTTDKQAGFYAIVVAAISLVTGGFILFAALMHRRYSANTLRTQIQQIKKSRQDVSWKSIEE